MALLVDPRQGEMVVLEAMLRLRARELPRRQILADSELERCERAERSLRDYIAQAWHIVEPAAEYQDNWHIAAIAEHLEAVTRGEIRDLIINVPPRFMKSLTVDVFWPTWEWIDSPHVRWLYNSYRQDLSVRDALKSRRLITSPWYQVRWGTRFRLAADQNLKGRYDNDQGGYRIATSVSGGNTGEGGDRIVADDPHNVKEGESELNRTDVVTWWNEVMPSRRNDPKLSSRVIIMQRVHEQDVIGDALEKGGYHLLRLPMEYDPKLSVDFGATGTCSLPTQDERTEDGELLWPERYGPDEVAKLKRDLGSYAYAAQYQQDPVPRAGAILDPGLFLPLTDELRHRPGLTRVQFWDTAFSGRETADYTAAVTLDLEPIAVSERMYLQAVYRDRLESAPDPAHPERPARLAQAMADHIAATKPHMVGVEEAAFKQRAVTDLISQVQKLLRARGISVSVRAIPVDRDKVTRARIVEGRLKAGDLYVDRSAPWWTAYAAELSAFPMRKEDDQVDATSGAVTMAVEHAQVLQQSRDMAALMRGGPIPIHRSSPGLNGQTSDLRRVFGR